MSNISHEVGATIKNLSVTGVTVGIPSATDVFLHLKESGLTIAGDHVNGWLNEGTSGGTLTPLSGRTSPHTGTGLNGYDTVLMSYDAGDGGLAVTLSSGIVVPYTLMFLAKYAVPASGKLALPFRLTAGTNFSAQYAWMVMSWNTGANCWRYLSHTTIYDLLTAGAARYYGNPTGDWSIYSLTVGADGVVAVQNQGEALLSASSVYTSTFRSFELGNSVSRHVADFAEVLGWRKILSADELAMAVRYLNMKYGLI